jgi:hypothetical protein
VNIRQVLGAAMLCVAVTSTAAADPWHTRREWREGAREVAAEKREAAREIRKCKTRECMMREVREGQREVSREHRETWREVQRVRANDRWYRDTRYFDDRNWRYRNVDTHYHPDGRFCRDGSHLAHLRDTYYRGDRRWYRDGRYWNEYDYVGRYYRGGGGNRNDDDDEDLVKGILIGAAAVGVIAAIHDANDED